MLNRVQRSHSFAAAVLMWMGLVVSPVGAYEVIDVQHGGTLDGTVTLSGGIPAPKAFNLITFPDPTYCGRISNGSGWRLLRDFIVSQEGELKNAIVTLEGVETGKAFDMSVPLIEGPSSSPVIRSEMAPANLPCRLAVKRAAAAAKAAIAPFISEAPRP